MFQCFKSTVAVIIFLFTVPLICCAQYSQLFKDSTIIQAKIWSKDEDKKVHYSDWTPFVSYTVKDIKRYNPETKESIKKSSNYSNGYFHTNKIDGRWYVVTPYGDNIIINAVNSIRVSKEEIVPQGFSSKKDWMSKTIDTLQQLGFNTAGCWSDTAAIIEYNKNTSSPIAYTVQLNLLSGFASEKKKSNPELKSVSVLSFIFDEDFKNYCRKKCKLIVYLSNDQNLLGYFSDNELPFTSGELKTILKENNNTDKSYIAYQDWIKSTNADTLSDETKKKFLGFIAQKYYDIVSKYIKEVDSNHMYIGSRLHSNAKNNKYIFEAANKYVDIFSINYYGDWKPKQSNMDDWAKWSTKPFFITEFYTKAEETGMSNKSGAGWIVKSQKDRGVHYQNFCLPLLQNKNCVGWHWFRYQDNDPNDSKADESNKDSNKGIVNVNFQFYKELSDKMSELNNHKYQLIKLFDSNK